MQLLIPQPILGQRPHLEVLHQDVALRDQLQRHRLPGRRGNIQRDTPLVPVHPNEIGAFLRARHHRRGKAAGVVTGTRPLNLEHVRAEVRQHLRAGWSGKNAGQVKHPQAFQRAARGRDPVGSCGCDVPGGFVHGGLHLMQPYRSQLDTSKRPAKVAAEGNFYATIRC